MLFEHSKIFWFDELVLHLIFEFIILFELYFYVILRLVLSKIVLSPVKITKNYFLSLVCYPERDISTENNAFCDLRIT